MRPRALVAAVVVAALLPSAATAAPAAVKWRPAGFSVSGTRAVRVATITAGGAAAYVARIDTRATRLALYPSGSVPHGQRWRLLATFNGGFKPGDGGGGLAVNWRAQQPLQSGMGTLVESRDGSVGILDWGGATPLHGLVLARQNLPPLVWAGRPTPRTADTWLWGATLGHVAATWRSAVGVTRSGDLVYAAAGDQTAASLAALMVRFGAVRAIELDINPEWPSFVAYGARGGRDPLKLVPNPQQSAYRYLVPDTRDFFAVYTRAGGGAAVPFR